MAITVKPGDGLEKKIAEVYPNKTSGAEEILQAWYHLRNYTLQELKGKFTEQELCSIVDAYNGTIFESRFTTHNQFLKIQIEDSKNLKQFSQNWKINWDKFFEKIDSLTSAQTFFLLEEVQRFWEKDSQKENNGIAFIETLKS